MMATQLLVLASAGFLLRAERKQLRDDCASFTTPCGCTADGCGWSSRLGKCIAGETTDCLECPNVLLCGDETCVQTLFQDKRAVADMRAGKQCMDDGKDMADCMCSEGGDRLKATLDAAGCCGANELFSQFCNARECSATDDCGSIDEPCACGLRKGCGWQNGECTEGGATSCDECPNTLLCTSDSCTGRTFRDPDFLEAINRGKVCMESLRPTDTFESCLDTHGDALKTLIEKVGSESGRDCCKENKFFAMACGEDIEAVSTKAGVGEACDNDDSCADGLVCAKDGKCHETMQAGQGPCGKDGDCADGLVCGSEDKCIERLGAGQGPCGEDGDCTDGLTCGEAGTCVDQAALDAAAKAAAEKEAADKAAEAGAGDEGAGDEGAGDDAGDSAGEGAGDEGAGDGAGDAAGDGDGAADGSDAKGEGDGEGDDDEGDDDEGDDDDDAGAGADKTGATDGINALNAAAAANHGQLKAAVDSAEAEDAQPPCPRKMDDPRLCGENAVE